MSRIPVAFYAPLKSPDHPQPSGDRTMARLLIAALRLAGFEPTIASVLRTFEPLGDARRQGELAHEASAETDRLAARFAALAPEERPRLWFTYHSYYKAPDHLGPGLSRRLGIPYAIAEASRADKRAGGPWSFSNQAAEEALAAADVLFAATRRDREALSRRAPPGQRLLDLPPFIDARPYQGRSAEPYLAREGPVRLLAVAMMREGDKLASYRLLAAALARIAALDWCLTVVGDGPARATIEGLFRPFGDRVAFAGLADQAAVAVHYDAADILVWPAVNEAYGMVLLEAQASGCPVVAGAFGGVPDVVQPAVTGLMPPAGDPDAFADAVAELISSPQKRQRLGCAARRFVTESHDIRHAAAILAHALNARGDGTLAA